jgi:hypothetical protein
MAQVSFQQGVNDYVGTSDTMLRQYHPSQDYGSATSLSVDSKDPEGNVNQILLRFDHLFGTGLGQIPQDATITSATLTLTTSDPGGGASVHRLLTAWSETATYNSLGDGIQADGTEAVTAADLVTGGIGTLGPITLDVTNSVQAWVDGADNNGWAFLPSSNDGWDFSSSESGQVPVLTVNYTLDPGTPGGEPPGETNIAPVATNDSYSTIAGQALTITTAQGVLANDTDANGDALIALKVSDPIHGTLGLNADGAFSYTPAAGYSGPDSFDYAVRDGHGGTDTATVNLTVSPTTLPPAAHTYDHVFLVFMENHSASEIYSNANAPFINDVLRASGETFTNMHAIARPSQPNYLAFYSGSTQGVTNNNPHDFGSTQTLGDQFAAAGLSLVWEAEAGTPARHLPTTSFDDSAYERSFESDWPAMLSNLADAPEFVAISPDDSHSLHDGSVAQGDAWLQANFSSVLDFVKNPANNSLFVLTFDEPSTSAPLTTPIPTVAVGAGIAAGISDNTNVNLYSLLQEFEQQHNFALLGSAATAPDLVLG